MKIIDDELAKIRKMDGVKGVLIASTSGGYVAGEPPSTAHLETFTTMSAILLGAAQTATKELKDRLRHVEVRLEASRLLILPAGNTALFVIEVDHSADRDSVIHTADVVGRRISELL